MVGVDSVIAEIVKRRATVPNERGLLVGLSGIDGSGKGFLSNQIEARIDIHPIAMANINVDGWLNLPNQRFDAIRPAEHFYENAIRFDELFRKLLLPLREQRSANLVANFAEETSRHFRRHTYNYKNIDVALVEGIFLFKREYRELFDLTIWVDCSYPTALARALARKQEGLSPAETICAYETIYFPAQRIHIENDNPREFADLIINNDPYLEPRHSVRNLSFTPGFSRMV